MTEAALHDLRVRLAMRERGRRSAHARAARKAQLPTLRDRLKAATFGRGLVPAPGEPDEIQPRLLTCPGVLTCLALAECLRWPALSCKDCPIYRDHRDSDINWLTAMLIEIMGTRRPSL